MTYSCDKCKNRHNQKRCKRCLKTADKKPSRFKLDKTSMAPCPAYENGLEECSLISDIRTWNEEIKQLDIMRSQIESIDTKPLTDLLLHMDKISYMYDGKGVRNRYDNEIVLAIVSDALHHVSCKEVIDTLTQIRDREEKLIVLRRQKADVQSKIDAAKRKLGI